MRYVSCNEISDTLQTDVVQIPNYLISFDIKRVEITDKFACIRKTEFGSNVRKKNDLTDSTLSEMTDRIFTFLKRHVC